MNDTAPEPAVRHVPAEHRFVVEHDGAVAELVDDIEPDRLILTSRPRQRGR